MTLGRIQVPPAARAGEVVEIRLLIQHPMEAGFRRDANGRLIPMNVVNAVVCRYGGREVYRAELGPGVAANPYFAFWVRAEASGEVSAEWLDDAGVRGAVQAQLVVS
jgi:sulfur-oxidizing protein SoxZ